MRKEIVFLAMIPITTASMLSWAQGNQPHLLALLEPTLERCEWKLRTLKGAPEELMRLHQAKMRRLLGELNAG